MEIAKIPNNENERIAALYSYNILNTDFEKQYDDIVKLASYVCDTPIAVISLVDTDKQWYKAKVGVEAKENSRDVAFCAHAINLDDILIVKDALEDNRFFDNPLVTQDPNIRFYVGAQLRTKSGHVLGTLCAIDTKPREISENQLIALKVLSQQVITMLELRKSNIELAKHAKDLNEQNNMKSKLFRIISHDLRSPFHSILGLSEILCEDIDELNKDEIKNLSKNISETATDSFELVDNLLNWSLHESELKEREFQDIYFSQLFKNIISVLDGVITKKGIKIQTDLSEESKIFADSNIIYSAFQNIIANAIKFTPRNGSIKIASSSKNGKIIISIKDSGIGLSEMEIEQLLSNNSKSSTSGTGGEKGTGLGFTIAKDFINLSNGIIFIESEKNKGTNVIVSFG